MIVFTMIGCRRACFWTKNDKNMLIVIAVVIFVLVVTDTMINQVADFLADQLISDFGVVLFVCFCHNIWNYSIYRITLYQEERSLTCTLESRSTRILFKIVSVNTVLSTSDSF